MTAHILTRCETSQSWSLCSSPENKVSSFFSDMEISFYPFKLILDPTPFIKQSITYCSSDICVKSITINSQF